MLFDKQYILTETVTTETRYRTETRTDSEGNEYEVAVPYTYYICTVELENFDLSHVPVYIMDTETLSMYAVYMSTLGNRSDLFPSSGYLPSEIEKFKDVTGYEEFLDFNPAEVKAALEDPTKSRVNEMLAAAERAEREYAAAAAAYVQTSADIVVQARAVQDQAAENSFSIYQLKGGNETLDYRFEPLDSIHRNGLSVKPENYELVY